MATGDEILGWEKEIENQAPIERTDCPICDWELEKNPDGILHCPLCGWSEVRRIRLKK